LPCPNFQILWQHSKSQPGTGKSNPPPYLPNGDRLGEVFCTIMFRTLKNGGVGHLQIHKKKPQLFQNAHITKKLQIFYILQTLHF
jgi:hypothetical protein